MTSSSPSDTPSNPLEGIDVGSTLTILSGIFHESALSDQNSITTCQAFPAHSVAITGSYDSGYNSTMNMGSLSLSGTYGLSLISTVSGSISGYLGNATATNSNTTKIDYHNLMQSHVEWIDFDNIKLSDFVNSLKLKPKQLLSTALVKFTALSNLLLASSKNTDSTDPAKIPGFADALSAWLQAREDFFQAEGTGLVVGILWGAVGTISWSSTSQSNQSSWKYGGEAQFNYASDILGISVDAKDSGSSSSGGGSNRWEMHQYTWGSALDQAMDTYATQLMSTQNMTTISFQQLPEFPTESLPQPAIPQLKTPQADPTLTKQLQDLQNLKQIQAIEKEEQNQIKNTGQSDGNQTSGENPKADLTSLNNLILKMKQNMLIPDLPPD